MHVVECVDRTCAFSRLSASGVIAVCENADSVGLMLSREGCDEAWASQQVSCHAFHDCLSSFCWSVYFSR